MATQAQRLRVPDWRGRVLPRTVLGLTTLILFSALGAAFSGAVLFAYYQYRLDQNEAKLTTLVDRFDNKLADAQKLIETEREDAKDQIRKELEPLQRLAASGDTLEEVLGKVTPSMWFVVTKDDAGAPSVGSAFVVASDSAQSFLLTSFTSVKALTQAPTPSLSVRKGNEEIAATLWTWDEARDLALLVVEKGGQPRLKWADGNSASIGDRVFAISGLGAANGAITQGAVADVSASGVQHDAAVGPSFQGGPLVNSQGEVLAVASRTYSPLGFAPRDVYFGVPIRAACESVLRCPSGNAAGAADRR